MRIRALGFDFDHTLGIDNKLERVAFLRLLEDVCADGGASLGTLADEIVRIDVLLEEQRSGACSIEAAVAHFVQEHGIRKPQSYVDRYKQLALESVDAFVVPQPDAAAVLRDLRERRVPHAILSNGWSPLQQRKALRIGFDGQVLVSSDIGTQKPQREAFAALCAALRSAPNETAYVGDNPLADVAGAMNAGLHGIWFDSEGRTYPAEAPAPSATVHALAELLAFL